MENLTLIPPSFSEKTMKKLTYLTTLPLLLFSMQIMAQPPVLNEYQDGAIKYLLSQYPDGCVGVEITGDSSTFSQGISLALHEKHLPHCWGGKGDPNVSPVFMHADIDRFGRIFKANVSEGMRLELLTPPWKHPTKKVFAQYGIEVLRVELFANNTYPIFYVSNEALFESSKTTKRREALFKALLKANAQWDFAIATASGKLYFIEGKKRKVPNLSQ